MSNFLTNLKQFFSGYAPHDTKKACPHCGGGRCIGACGNAFANLTQVQIQGIVQLESPTQGIIHTHNSIALTFDADQRWGRMILKKCPPGSECHIRALVKNNHLEKLISVKKP